VKLDAALRAADTRQAMSQENVEIARRNHEAFRRGDWEGFLRDVDPSVEFVELPAFGTRTYHGHEGLMDALRWWPSQWDEFESEILEVIDVDDEHVVSLLRNHGRGKTSGVEVAEEVALLSTIRNGKATRVEMFRSVSEALGAAGLRE
jgi:ketosteroid isomerase-like protein